MHIVRTLCLATGLSLAVAGNAAAADLYSGSTKDYPAPPLAQWQGPYWGVVVGATGSGVDLRSTHKDEPDLSNSAFSGGLVAGYNFRTGPWVGGFEADVSSAGFNDSKNVAGMGTVKASSNVTGSLRLRGGYAWERLFLYSTAGLAFSDLEVKSSLGGKYDSFNAGLALGLGAEYAIDPNWAVRAELIGYGFGMREQTLGGVKQDVIFGEDTIRFGLTRKF
jgi:outer membrane immunogenic protein